MLHYLPNCLTFSRLLLALPLGVLILRENYNWALGIGILAGLTDALDGFFARRFNALSRFGAILDPIADKTLITVSFLCLAQVTLIPWYLAIAVITRDIIIIAGAACYYKFIGPFEFSATTLSKINMVVQVAFCTLVLLSQVIPGIPPETIIIATAAVLFIAAASGFDYIMSWTIKAIHSRQRDE
jgi:cardiolipin synthase